MATLIPQCSGTVDWQTTKQTVRDRTAFLFNNSLMSDIKFVVTDSQHESDGTQVRVPAHKLVLAISSPAFEAMFYGDLAEKGEEIELPDTESHYLIEFLRFLYCEEVCLTTVNAFGVLYLAEKYIVPVLADRCWSFIDENTCACLKSDTAASTLTNSNLASLVKRDTLHITKELDLFDAVTQWAEAKSKMEDLEPTGEAVRKLFGEAINFVRFPTMSQQDFAEHVVPRGILTPEEALDMHQYFTRVIAVPDIKFPHTHRKSIISNACTYECNLYKNYLSLDDRSSFEERFDRLEFVVEPRNVHLTGIQLATTRFTDIAFTADVQLLNEHGDVLAKETFTATAVNYCRPICGFIVEFTDPVLIWKSCKYTIKVEVHAIEDGRNNQLYQLDSNPSEFVKVENVYFNLKGSSRQILKLFFCTL